MTNVRPIEIETSQSLKGILDNWNIGTNQWLKHYVYLRIAPIGSKNTAFASLCAFATSAFWHGFYPGYYLTFLLMGFVSETSKSKYIFN
jgi:lysophospholipid acyltransferase